MLQTRPATTSAPLAELGNDGKLGDAASVCWRPIRPCTAIGGKLPFVVHDPLVAKRKDLDLAACVPARNSLCELYGDRGESEEAALGDLQSAKRQNAHMHKLLEVSHGWEILVKECNDQVIKVGKETNAVEAIESPFKKKLAIDQAWCDLLFKCAV